VCSCTLWVQCGSATGHGGQGSTSVAGQSNPLTQALNFLGLDDENVQLYGRGHQQGHLLDCGT
jgi:hypothetical protein